MRPERPRRRATAPEGWTSRPRWPQASALRGSFRCPGGKARSSSRHPCNPRSSAHGRRDPRVRAHVNGSPRRPIWPRRERRRARAAIAARRLLTRRHASERALLGASDLLPGRLWRSIIRRCTAGSPSWFQLQQLQRQTVMIVQISLRLQHPQSHREHVRDGFFRRRFPAHPVTPTTVLPHIRRTPAASVCNAISGSSTASSCIFTAYRGSISLLTTAAIAPCWHCGSQRNHDRRNARP